MLKFLVYYSRKDIQKAIAEQAKNKEIGTRYGDSYGKRPDILQYDSDVMEFARKGATSFHISEETWSNPMDLMTGITKKQLDDLRKGWDLILDIDCPYWDYSKLTAYFLVDALKFHNVKNISIKFSGNKGWHLGVPFESFPDEVNGKKIKDFYPEGLRIIAAYLQNLIKPVLTQEILKKESLRDIVKRTGKTEAELAKDQEFDPFTVIDIDTILISSRHLYRAAYSLHEKSGLVSLPIDPAGIMTFDKESAQPSKVKPNLKFLDRTKIIDKEARELLIQAFDWHSKQSIKTKQKEEQNAKDNGEKKLQEIPATAIPEDKFPACIKKILEGKMEDGKKRSLFILLRFLRNVGWTAEATDKKIRDWNSSNTVPLSESYLASQMMWHKRQQELILPPNCTNNNYYKDLQICPGNDVCIRYKNPVNYTKSQAKIDSIKKKVRSSPSAGRASKAAPAPQKPNQH